MPRCNVDHPVEGVVAADPGLDLPLRVQQPEVAVTPDIGEESRLRSRLAGDAGERECDLFDGCGGEFPLELAAYESSDLFPIPHRLLEVDRPLPWGCSFENALQRHPAGVAALHPGAGVGSFEQGVYRCQQPFRRDRGERESGVFDDGLLVREWDNGVVVDAVGELPYPLSGDPELVDERLHAHVSNVAHGMQAEAVHAGAHLAIDGQQVDGVLSEEGGSVGRDARHA